jgi:hypothetical protein
MIRVYLKVALQFLLAMAPLFTMHWSLLDWLGYQASPTPPHPLSFTVLGRVLIEGPKEEVEFAVRAYLTALAVGGIFVMDTVEYYIPRRKLEVFRKEYLAQQLPVWRTQLSGDIRINLMFAHRPWWMLWSIRRFKWIWNDGFRPHDPDVNMWITVRQGVCGKAFKTKRPQSAYFSGSQTRSLSMAARWFRRNEFRLWGFQMVKTRHLKAVISIPIVQTSEGLSPKFTAVGVLNLDTDTPEGAQLLQENETDLAEYFHGFGKILAALRT